jgi:hypothetical protein
VREPGRLYRLISETGKLLIWFLDIMCGFWRPRMSVFILYPLDMMCSF